MTTNPSPWPATAGTKGLVAVVGMGIAVPTASSPEDFWQLLAQDEPVFRERGDRYPLDAFWAPGTDAEDHSYVRTSGFLTDLSTDKEVTERSEAGHLPASTQNSFWLRHCLKQALVQVGARDTDQYACYVGTSVVVSQRADEATLLESVAHRMAARLRPGPGACSPGSRLRALLRLHYRHPAAPSQQFLPDRMVRSAVAGLLPDDCEIGVVDAACSSSLYAIDLGAKSLIARNCDIALCGGVSCVSPRYNVAFAKLGGLSRSGNVRVFDRAADGTLFSDGAAVVALKLLDRAVDDGDRILGVLAGFGASSDGRGKAIHAPNPVGQALCVERARHAGRIEADEVDWVIAHGTGTPVGDAVELRTLEDAAPPTGYLCTSNKSLIGHTGWSAGTVSVIHLLLALQHERIPAQRGFTEPADAAVKAGRVRVPRVSTPWPAVGGRPRVAGVSSFGFGGANAHLLIQEYAPDRAVRATVDLSTDPLVLVAWSAQLPGDPARTEIESMFTDDTKPRRRAFDSSYPIPPFEEIRLPPRTARAVDRSQLMALHVAALFVAEHGEIWAPVRNSTGVMAAHTGPLPSSADHLVRCYAADLGAFLTGADARAFTAVLDDVRRTTPPTGNDTLTGIMPNILAARLANRYDLHGPALVLDTGRTAGLTAVRVAARYLRARELDLALILGVNANSRPDLAALVGVPEDRLAEGAFLVALSRESVADDHGWPVLAHISVDETDPIPASVRITCGGKETDDRVSYLGADGVVALLRALCRGAPSATVVPAPGEVGPAVTVRRTGVRSTESSAT